MVVHPRPAPTCLLADLDAAPLLCPHCMENWTPFAPSPALLPQEEAPEGLQRNRAFQALQAHVRAMTDKHHSVPPAAGEAPKEWVRGWTDKGEELAPKPAS